MLDFESEESEAEQEQKFLEENKIKGLNLFNNLIYSINDKHINYFEDEANVDAAKNAYMPFIVNRNFSQNPETIFYANEMNLNHELTKRMNYDFYYYGLKKRKRFFKWAKKKNEDMNAIKAIQFHFGYSERKAKQVVSLFSKQDIKKMIDLMDEGGVN